MGYACEPVVHLTVWSALRRYGREAFYPTETDQQDYLNKNPSGYCHVLFAEIAEWLQIIERVWELTPEQYAVTQEAAPNNCSPTYTTRSSQRASMWMLSAANDHLPSRLTKHCLPSTGTPPYTGILV